MQFAPTTEAQMQAARLIPDDTECDFEVISAENKVSKKGNEMIALKLRVWHGAREAQVFDYLMPSMQFKLLHFCETTGLTARYASGNLTATDCQSKAGKVVIGVEEASGNYAAKNTVRDYVGHRETKFVKVGASAAPAPARTDGDDIPF